MSYNIIKTETVTFKYLKSPFSLGPITMSLDTGQITSVIGKNGSGKTTFLTLLAELLTPSTGKVVTTARENNTNDFECSLYTPGKLGLYPLLTGEENIEAFSFMLGADHKHIEKMIELWKIMAPFKEALKTQAGNCSTGMKNLLGLFRAIEIFKKTENLIDENQNLVPKEKVRLILLDEPFANLDNTVCEFLSCRILDMAKNHDQGLNGFAITAHSLDGIPTMLRNQLHDTIQMKTLPKKNDSVTP